MIEKISQLPRRRTSAAKRAFTTRRVPVRDMRTLLSGELKPASGDLLLASVHELGKHLRIERINGRRALMMPGDEIIVCYGNRYAPDQFEALVSEDLSLCDLVASGGIASREVCRHERMLPPTRIMPIGLIGNESGERLNVADYRIRETEPAIDTKVIVVAGTAMNSGKTYTAASVVRGLKESGLQVAGIKATGTGSGGDLWKMKDLGADVVLDFTDAGFSSTYRIPDADIEAGVVDLINHAAGRGCDFAIVEIADGLQHQETATLLRSQRLRSMTSGLVFAAYDSLGAKAGYQELRDLGYPVLAISGQVARSPLAMREAQTSVDCPIFTPAEIQSGALLPILTGEADQDALSALARRGARYAKHAIDPVVDFDRPEDSGLRLRAINDNHTLMFPKDYGDSA